MRDPDMTPKSPSQNQGSDPLKELTLFPSTFWDSCAKSIEQSREDIALAVQKAMKEQDISIYTLFERTGLSLDVLDSILQGTYDLLDSEPISKLESALSTRLHNL